MGPSRRLRRQPPGPPPLRESRPGDGRRAGAGHDPRRMSRPVGRGWATVELDRAEEEVRKVLVAELLFRDVAAAELLFRHTPRSALLGARCRRARTPDGEWIVLLEPDTEGRLAAFLARHGEGWAATWDTAGPPPSRVGGRSGVRGPLGPELLAHGQPVDGPFRLVLTTATIES